MPTTNPEILRDAVISAWSTAITLGPIDGSIRNSHWHPPKEPNKAIPYTEIEIVLDSDELEIDYEGVCDSSYLVVIIWPRKVVFQLKESSGENSGSSADGKPWLVQYVLAKAVRSIYDTDVVDVKNWLYWAADQLDQGGRSISISQVL